MRHSISDVGRSSFGQLRSKNDSTAITVRRYVSTDSWKSVLARERAEHGRTVYLGESNATLESIFNPFGAALRAARSQRSESQRGRGKGAEDRAG